MSDERGRRFAKAVDSVLADEFLTRAVTAAILPVIDDEASRLRESIRQVNLSAMAEGRARDAAETERDQWRAQFERLSTRNLEMAERHSEALHRAAERAKVAEAKVASVEALLSRNSPMYALGEIRAALATPIVPAWGA